MSGSYNYNGGTYFYDPESSFSAAMDGTMMDANFTLDFTQLTTDLEELNEKWIPVGRRFLGTPGICAQKAFFFYIFFLITKFSLFFIAINELRF